MQEDSTEFLGGPTDSQKVIGMQVAENLKEGQTKWIIGGGGRRTSWRTSRGMLTKLASLPDLRWRFIVGGPMDLRLAERLEGT